jgi:hypothetical protein
MFRPSLENRSVIAFNCPKCRQALEFAEDSAGRVVRCPTCRVKLRLPGAPPSDDEPVVTRRRRKKRRRRQVEESNEIVDTPEWIAPTALLGVGLMLSVGSMTMAKGGEGFAEGVATVGLQLLLTIPLSIAGLLIMAPLLGVNFGSFGMAILKLAAVNVSTLSIAMMCQFTGIPAFLAFSFVAPIGWLLFHWLFQLEPTETMYVLTVIWLIQFLADLTLKAAQLRGR